ncbi:alpha/beta hydrolase fold domain-containing protein [Streptomyces sp. NPDC054770]
MVAHDRHHPREHSGHPRRDLLSDGRGLDRRKTRRITSCTGPEGAWKVLDGLQAARANAAVVFVEYDRSPEVRYPVASEQAYAAARSSTAMGTEAEQTRA